MKTKIQLLLGGAMFCVVQLAYAEPIFIKAGHLLDVVTGKITNNQVITIDNGIIVNISNKLPDQTDLSKVIDLSNKFVMPGLMDMHTHVVNNLSKAFYDGYFQSPHRATIGGIVNAE